MDKTKYGIYIHIPYCKSRCRYCNFYVNTTRTGVPEEYIEKVLSEFQRLAPKGQDGNPLQPCTLYFGGGTPGLLTPQQVEHIIKAIHPLADAEITLEANPENAVLEKLAGWRKAGVNRISFGVQTANPESLRRLGRLLSPQDAAEAIQQAKRAGFENISGDIMLALPHYSKQEFEDTLALLSGNGVTHISAYILKVEEGTAFYKNRPEEIPTEDEAAEYYLYACQRMEQEGFHQYEISNFAKGGYEGKHNLLYWNCDNYLGLGPAAHSCMEGKRFSYAPDVEAFLTGTPLLQPEGIADAEDYIMLRLRLREGLQEEELLQRYGVVLTQKQKELLGNLQKAGLCERVGKTWKLTAQGFLVQNIILGQLLA